MIKTFQQVDSSGKLSLQKIASFKSWIVFYVQVRGPQTLTLSTSEEDLESGAGISITSQDGIQKFSWIGDIWGTGSGQNTVADFQFPGGTS